jgi:transposase
MTAAIAAVRNGAQQKAAAELYGVSKSTLSRRLRGGVDSKKAQENNQLLSPASEAFLVGLIKDYEVVGKTCFRWEISQIAQCILAAQGRRPVVGHNWVNRFIKAPRHSYEAPSFP